jgi:4-amino-4-deoxy-L-arabinose transferase-like glycosyltransferase
VHQDGALRHPRSRYFAVLLLLGMLMFLPRGLAVDRMVSPDEKRWLTHSANFYRALTHGELDQTYQIEHPGVTIMWVGTLNYLWRYPSYPWEAPSQVDWRRQEVASFLWSRGREPLDLLTTAHLLMAMTISLVLATAGWWAFRLFGVASTSLGLLFVAADPFHIGLSRLLHLDGLTSAFVLLSLMALLCYLYRGGRRNDLVVAGLAGGLAALSKSPALFLAPFTGFVFLLEQRARSGSDSGFTGGQQRWAVRAFMLWAAVALGVFVLLWPAMWVDPILTVGRVVAAAVGYAVQGHEDPLYFRGRIFAGDPGWEFYPVSYLWRTTPPVLAGLVLAAAALTIRGAQALSPEQRRPLAVLLLFALLFTAFMSLGSKKFDRYVLAIYPPLALVAAAGWTAACRWVRQHCSPTAARATITVLVLSLVGAQIALARAAFPYYFSYYNPLLGGTSAAPAVMMVGWGEGLDQVARYLDSRADVPSPRVMIGVWGGTFSYFFHGRIRDSKFAPGEATIRDWKRSDFCVIYINQWQRQQIPNELLEYLSRRTPAFVLRLQGLTYAYVYDIRGVPPPNYMSHRPSPTPSTLRGEVGSP